MRSLSWFGVVGTLTLSLVASAGSLFGEDPKAAFANAKSKNRPLIIDFYGIWCPPCAQLDALVFETSEFVEKSKNFELLKVDVDKPESLALKNKYHVKGYPTVVFADPTGKEIYRTVGFDTARGFFVIMDLMREGKPKHYKDPCKGKSEDDLWICAILSDAMHRDKAEDEAFKKLEGKLKPGSPRYLLARTYQVSRAPNEDLKRNALESLLSEYPTSPKALDWAVMYLAIFEKEPKIKPKKDLVEKVLTHYEVMLKDPDAEALMMTPGGMASDRASVLSDLGKKDEAKKAWREVADRYAALAKTLPADVPTRAFAFDRIQALDAAGDRDAALKLAAEYQEKFPNEFTFYSASSGILEDAKRYKEALAYAQRAYGVAYGANKVRVATRLVRIMTVFHDREGIKKIYDEVKKENPPNEKADDYTTRVLKEFDETYHKSQST